MRLIARLAPVWTLLTENTSTSETTTLASFCLAIAKLVESYGLDAAKLFSEAGVDLQLARDPLHRFPISKIAKVWRKAAMETGSSALGLELADYYTPTSFHALSMSLWASGSLMEMLERYVRFAAIVSEAMELSIRKHGEETDLIVVNCEPLRAYEGVDSCVSSILGVCRQVSSDGLAPLRVEMERPEPKDIDRFKNFFKAPIKFSAARTALVFRTAELVRSLPNANEALARHNDGMSASYLTQMTRHRWSSKVYIKLIQALPAGDCSEKKIADLLAINPDKLRKTLREEGVSYRQILNDTRKQLAMHYLDQHQLSLIEIGYLLGFSEPSNFSRAFRRWTGFTPGAYRKQLQR